MSFHIIADQDTVLGYRFAGVAGTVVADADQARTAFKEATTGEACSVLLLSEPVELMLEAETTEHRLSAAPPYIVVVPDVGGHTVKRKSLEDLIHEAVGIKIVTDR